MLLQSSFNPAAGSSCRCEQSRLADHGPGPGTTPRPQRRWNATNDTRPDSSPDDPPGRFHTPLYRKSFRIVVHKVRARQEIAVQDSIDLFIGMGHMPVAGELP
jgi:hypothetical protein